MKLFSRWLGIAATLGLLAAACEPEYAYLPVTNATVVRGQVNASYPIPADMPHGDLRVASYGIVDVGPRNARENEKTRALHLRFTITNNADREWTFDTREQRVELAGYGVSAPAYVSADTSGSAPPVVTVPALGKRTIDLFFPLPINLQHAKQLPTFDVVWRVQANGKFISHRTPFERVELTPPPDYYGPYDYGADYWWGPPYWYNPGYGETHFVGGAVPPHFYHGPVDIHRSSGAPYVLGPAPSNAPAQPRSR